MKKVSARQKRIDCIGWLFMTPAITFGLIFLIIPILMCFCYSFTDFYMLRPEATEFAFLANYITLFKDAVFGKTIINTLQFVIFVVPIQCLLAFCLAMLINKKYKLFGIFKLAFFAPVITSMTVVSLLFEIFYKVDGGIFNLILNNLGIASQGFLTDEKQAMYCIIFMSIWQGAGYQMIIFLAGLQGVSKELYEAAELDGAKGKDKFFSITLPSLSAVNSFVILITLVGAFKMFVQAYIMTNGGPNNATATIVYYIFEKGMSEKLVGYGSAISILFTLVFVVASLMKSGVIKLFDTYKNYRYKIIEEI